jgi:uncharacterized protein YwgA
MKEKQFLLLLIGSFGHSIEGETRLQKLVFLAKEEYGIQLPFEFKWSNYGPFSGDLRDYLQKMEIEGLLEQREVEMESHAGPYMIRVFTLTEKGKRELSSIEKEHQSEDESINKLFERFGQKRLHDILAYVYGRYEETEEGEIVAVSNFA